MKLFRLFSVLLTLCLLFTAALFAREAAQDKRIVALITAVEKTPGAQFIRNGQAYDAKAAADHLRLKLKSAGERVQTAEQFIENCATKSSISGQKYRIRLADGTEIDCDLFLQKKLKAIDGEK